MSSGCMVVANNTLACAGAWVVGYPMILQRGFELAYLLAKSKQGLEGDRNKLLQGILPPSSIWSYYQQP